MQISRIFENPDKIDGVIDRFIFQEINEMYTQFMAQELISSETKKKKKKKKKSQKKGKKGLKISDEQDASNEGCTCASPQNCEIKPFVDALAHSLLASAMDQLEPAPKKRSQKKSHKKASRRKNAPPPNPSLVPEKSFSMDPSQESLEKQEVTSKGSEDKIKEDFVFANPKKPEPLKFERVDSFENVDEEFIEVRGKKPRGFNKQSRFTIKPHKPEKFPKGSSKSGKSGSEKKAGLAKEKPRESNNNASSNPHNVSLELEVALSACSLPSKKKSSIDEKPHKEARAPQPETCSSNTTQPKTPQTGFLEAPGRKSQHYNHHYLESELEKELKHPPSIHLSKNKNRKEENSSRTISTKGIDTGEATSPSVKREPSSSLHAAYLSGDDPLPEISLVNLEEFRFEPLDEEKDQPFCERVNQDLNEFLTEMQENAPHIMNYRSLMFERLFFIVSSLFPEYQPSLQLYGSCATGLALPTSDMDIGVTGFETLSTYESTQILQALLSKLTFLKWVKTYRPIFTASIPVLKLVHSSSPFPPMPFSRKWTPSSPSTSSPTPTRPSTSSPRARTTPS